MQKQKRAAGPGAGPGSENDEREVESVDVIDSTTILADLDAGVTQAEKRAQDEHQKKQQQEKKAKRPRRDICCGTW